MSRALVKNLHDWEIDFSYNLITQKYNELIIFNIHYYLFVSQNEISLYISKIVDQTMPWQ